MPATDAIFASVKDNLGSGHVDLVVVNKTNKDELLDQDTGALKMRAEFNIYLGGNMLDRGITVPSMIAFYYGRKPKTMQADTVLQHSRMFGSRPRADMLVTRLFTSTGIHARMKAIHDLDTGLRQALIKGVNDHGVALIQGTRQNGIRFCVPNKIKLTEALTVSPGRTLAPKNIRTKSKDVVKPITDELDRLIDTTWNFTSIDPADAARIIELASETMDFDGQPFDWAAMTSMIKYYLEVDNAPGLLVTVATDRNLAWEATRGKTGLSIMGETLRRKVELRSGKSPVLVLLRQNGEVGWGGEPFWWPVLFAPLTASSCVYASNTPTKN